MNFFKPWIRDWQWGIRISLFMLLLSGMVQFGLFALNQNYVISYFGAQPEDVSLSSQLTYAGIIATLPIQFRFIRYFERRSYLLFIIACGILLSLASMNAVNIYQFMVLRILTGIEVCCLAGAVLMLIFASLKQQTSMIIGSSVFYGTILSNVVLIGILSAWVTDNFDWYDVYRYLIIYQVFTLIVTLCLLNKNAGVKSYPLYQTDWVSFVLCLTATMSLAYTIIYGPKYYWFTDPRIQLSAFIATAAFVLLFYRQITLKRPYLHLDVFKYRKFIIGIILLLIYYGIKDSINLIYAYCAIVVRWDTYKIMWLAGVNLAGVVIFMVIAAKLILSGKVQVKPLFITGLLSLLLYHAWMYKIFTPDLSFADLAIPVFLQGAASGFLFVPVVIYAVSSLPAYTGFTGITFAALARFTATLNSIAGFYTLQLHYNQLNKETFLRHLNTLDNNFSGEQSVFIQLYRSKGFTAEQANALSLGNITRALTVQGQLLTNMHVFKLMSIILVCLLILILLFQRIPQKKLIQQKK
jgi:DHA2 family multidrug resistance protein